MGLFKRKQEIRAETASRTEPEIESQLLRALIGRDTVSKDMALAVPTVAACISLIASKVAMCPIRLYKQLDGRVEEIKSDHRLFLLNHDTGDTMTAPQFWGAVIEDYFLGKGAYAYIRKDGTHFDSIYYVDESRISVQKNENPIFKDYMIAVQGDLYYPFEFLKVLRKTKDGSRSKPLTETSKLQIAVAYNALVYENALVKKGGNKKGFLKSQRHLTDEAMTNLKEAFKQLYTNNAEEAVVVLNDGMEFKESASTSVEMQLNENKITNAGEIAKLFCIPVTVLEGKGTDKDDENLVKNAVMPVLNDIEASLDRDLLTEQEKTEGYYFAFDTRELTRGSLKERYDAYAVGLQNNFLQIDEVRDKEDLEPLGIKWLTLGLDKVLYNPENQEVYTPNTNQWVKFNSLKGTEIGGENKE